MKRVRCPRCDRPLFFDETRCEGGHAVHLHCDGCGRNFSLRKSVKNESRDSDVGAISVLENDWCFKQVFPLALGENIIGRRSKGTEVQVPIDSGDDTLARNHAILQVKSLQEQGFQYSLKDFSSKYGTFVNGERLARGEWRIVHNGDMVVLGSTTLQLCLKED